MPGETRIIGFQNGSRLVSMFGSINAKEKGMRRPSWNKSQAIQQVIMLETLLETTPDSESGSQKRIRFSRPNNYNIPEGISKGTRNDAEDSMSVGETVQTECRKELDKHDYFSGGLAGCLHAVNNSVPSRITGLPSIPIGQMTIFYCGKVNVYDDLPDDKARSILNIAASPVQMQEHPVDGTMLTQPLPHISKAFGVKAHPESAVLLPKPQRVGRLINEKSIGGRNEDSQLEKMGGGSSRQT
ncbi:TIFY [Castilleja foliolosa]|uniref:Protein TIFY n=1 Tax=Castilleja foliolosa TaxID=1961234 RepID=A0ABD3CV31_9LAMI